MFSQINKYALYNDKDFSLDDDTERYLLRNNIYLDTVELKSNYSNIKKETKASICVISKIGKDLEHDVILIKTYKHGIGIMDGDIDVIVHNEDINSFVERISEFGFSVESEGKDKYKCSNKGFVKIEPRINISYLKNTLFVYEDLLKHSTYKRIHGYKIRTAVPEMDFVILLLGSLFGPRYIDLYLFKLSIIFKKKIENIVGEYKLKDIYHNYKKLTKENINSKFPLYWNLWQTIKFSLFKLISKHDIRGVVKLILYSAKVKTDLVLFSKYPNEKHWYK